MTHKHQILDHTGHSEKAWEAADTVGVAEAEKRFVELTGKGFLAFEPGKDGEAGRQLKAFDPSVEITTFTPSLQGG